MDWPYSARPIGADRVARGERCDVRGDHEGWRREALSTPGQLVDVGGYRLHLQCVGQGSPTVVLDAGLGSFSLDWGAVQPQLATTTRVCAYDRAGLGWSEPGPLPRSPQQFADELHVLLTNAGVEGPYVLVAHSISGKTARLFASQHPNEVVGMVLVDARHESVDEHLTVEQVAAEDAQQQRFQTMIKWMARFGLVRLLWAPAWPRVLPGTENLAPETRTAIGVLQARPRQIETALAEGRGRLDSNTLLGGASAAWGHTTHRPGVNAEHRAPTVLEGRTTDHDRPVVEQPPDRGLERPRCSLRAAGTGGGEHPPGSGRRAYGSAVAAVSPLQGPGSHSPCSRVSPHTPLNGTCRAMFAIIHGLDAERRLHGVASRSLLPVVAAQEVDLEVVESSGLDTGPDIVDKAYHEPFVVDGAQGRGDHLPSLEQMVQVRLRVVRAGVTVAILVNRLRNSAGRLPRSH